MFSSNGKLLAAVVGGDNIILWDIKTGCRLGKMSGADGPDRERLDNPDACYPTEALAFSPDGRYLAVGRDDGSIYLYSLKTFLAVSQIGCSGAEGDRRIGIVPLRWIAFDADGRTLYGIGQNGSNVYAWNVRNVSP